MKSKKNSILKICLMAIIFIGLSIGTSRATIHSSDPKGNVNSTVSITLTSTEPLENFDLSISSTGGLTYSSVSSSGATNTDTGKVSYAGLTGVTTLATYTFKTPSTPGKYTVVFNINGETNSSYVTVVNPNETNDTNNNENNDNNNNDNSDNNANSYIPTKSSNANLRNLGIKPDELDFTGFKPWETAYNVTVPNEVEQVEVYAKVQDSKASLTGTGTKKLNVGKNAFNVVVTAEDGTKNTYTINVTREEAKTEENTTSQEETTEDEKTEEENQQEVNTSNSNLIKLEIAGCTLTPEFSPDVYEYKLNVNGDISSLDVITEGANHNVSIEVVGNTDLVDGENIITILVHNEETDENETYQIVVNKTNVDIEGVNTVLNNGTNTANKIRYILLGIVIFIVVCTIIFFIVRKKYKSKDLENDIYEYDEEDMDRINKQRLNLDEEEDFFNRVNNKKIDQSEEEKVPVTSIADFNIDRATNANEETNSGIGYKEEQEKVKEYGEDFFRTSNPKRKGKHF